jgi:hypothetical protein
VDEDCERSTINVDDGELARLAFVITVAGKFSEIGSNIHKEEQEQSFNHMEAEEKWVISNLQFTISF